LALIGSVLLLGIGSKTALDQLLALVERLDVQVEILSFFALAIGTSLPELVVSIRALRRGQGDIVLGNIIGSCMFNMLLIGGVSSMIFEQSIDITIIPWVLAGLGVSVLLLAVGGITNRIHVWEGYVYILIYTAISMRIV